MSEFLIVLTQYLRLMLSVDTTELCLKLHPLGPETMSLVPAVSVSTELVLYSAGVVLLRQGRCLCRRNSGLASRRSSLCVLNDNNVTLDL